MSEEKTPVVETVVEAIETREATSPDAGLIAESKKYRTRAQTAETELAKLQKKLGEQVDDELKKNEEWKTLAEQNEAKLNDALPYKDKYEALYSVNKEKLLSQFPEDQQEKFKDKDPEWLESLLEAQGKNDFTETSERASVPKNQENGGFSNTTEWAQKDPVGFTKHLEANVKGYIK
jgi:seryl-tRNA synthetase